jgi:glycosyltransferase involved in cell wall biosynthesis
MISVIIASANKELLANVSENVKSTIGVDFEIISFDNANAEKGICEVYNIGIAKAKYDVLCFMHEDIKIHTDNWGKCILDIFEANKKLGLIGIAGSLYKAMSPSSWFSWLDQYNRFNLVQRYKFSDTETKVVYQNPNEEKLAKVNGVDGVWFCTHKRVTDDIKFDERLLKGFHGYDVDFSLSVAEKWDVAVTFDVLIAHFSEGNYDNKWIESTLLVHEKWKASLPKGKEYLAKGDALECEKKAFLFFIDQMWSAGYTKISMWRILWKSGIYTHFGFGIFFKLVKYIGRKK